MTTYRSAEEFEARFESRPHVQGHGFHRFPVEEYLEARGEHFADRFDPGDFLALSASIDGHRVDPGSVRAPSILVSFDTDALVPPWLVQELADRLGGPAVHHRLRSPFGHDGFLKESEAVNALLRPLFAESGGGR
jgi:homoserine O-acetyltransferase